ncbi:pentatricopeptide repeat-containing protein At3g53360, mitochondrial-like [Wolffia australiana]
MIIWRSRVGFRTLGHRQIGGILFFGSSIPVLGLNEYGISRLLKIAAAGCPSYGRRIVQAVAVKLGFLRYTVLATALMSVAIKRDGDLREAKALFEELPDPDVVSWSSIIVGCAQRGFYTESLGLFRRMIAGKTDPNAYSYSGALLACSGLRSLKLGREIQTRLIKLSPIRDLEPILRNNLLNLFSRCRDLRSAENLFGFVSDDDVVSWNEMISCYLDCGLPEESLKLFSRMISTGIKPDRFTLATIADACGSMASLRQGIQIHAAIIKNGLRFDRIIGSAMIDMYGRSGSVCAAELLFEEISSRDAILWTTMIKAYARGGFAKEAVAIFEEMERMKVKPDEIAFLAVLTACSHGGEVKRGWEIFRAMEDRCDVAPSPEIYSCLVDLLCRSGRLDEASILMEKISPTVTPSMKTTFLSSCRLPGEEDELARAGRTEEEMVKKEPGCSWVETEDGSHVFVAESRSHPRMREIVGILYGLNVSLRESH